jgi:hypothetical protein
MLKIPRRYSHFIFGTIQSGITSLIAAGIASFPSITHWLISWLISWVAMLPVVIMAAPLIRTLSLALTQEETQ